MAFFGVFLGEQLRSRYPDAIASMVIRLILAVVAIFLAYESKSLLIGETADLELIRDVEQIVREDPAVGDMRRPLAVQPGGNNIFLALDVQFKPNLSSAKLIDVVDELEKNIRKEHKSVNRMFIETDRLKEAKEKSNHH